MSDRPKDVQAAIARLTHWTTVTDLPTEGFWKYIKSDICIALNALQCAAAERPLPDNPKYVAGTCPTCGAQPAQAERQVAGAGKFTVTFRPYPAGAGSRVHDESWTIEGNSLRDALDKFYCKPEFNSEWRVVDAALPAERVPAEELAKLIAKWRDGISKCCPSVLEPGPKPSREYADVHQGCARQARDADEVEAILRPTHTPESGQ